MRKINNYIQEKLIINNTIKNECIYCNTLKELITKYNLKAKYESNKIITYPLNKQITDIFLCLYNDCYKNSTYDLETEIKNKFLKNTKYNFYITIKNNQVYIQILKDGVLKVLSIYFAVRLYLTINTRHLESEDEKLCYNIVDYIFEKYSK